MNVTPETSEHPIQRYKIHGSGTLVGSNHMKQIAQVFSSASPHPAGTRRDPLACIVENLSCFTLPPVMLAAVSGGPSAPEMQALPASGLFSASGNLSQPTRGLTGQRLDCIFVSHQLECVSSSITKRIIVC